MPVGLSDGSYHEDYTTMVAMAMPIPKNLTRVPIVKDPEVSPGTNPGDYEMVVHPNLLPLRKELDQVELDPTSGLGLDVSFKRPLEGPTEPADALKSTGGSQVLGNGEKAETDIDWSRLNQPFGSIRSTSKEDTPVVARAAGGIVITEGDIAEATNVGMGVGPAMIAGVRSKAIPPLIGKAAFDVGRGKDPIQVARETGWYKGSDNNWRYEISDEGMKLVDRDWKIGEQGKLKDFVDHPELFKAYPDIADINFVVAPTNYKSVASYRPSTKTLMINPSKIESGDEGILDVLAHELQHVIQVKENFSVGGSMDVALSQAVTSLVNKMKQTKDPEAKREMMDLFLDIHDNARSFAHYMYTRIPGEVEANSVAARRKLPENLRREFPVKEMEKIMEGEYNAGHGGTYVTEFNYP